MGIGAAFLAQNWMGFVVALLFFFLYCAIAREEDKELIRWYGTWFEAYVRSKPMFFPRLRDLRNLVKLVFNGS